MSGGTVHAEMIQKAASWLANQGRCYLVVTDLVTAAGETPDAIGWNGYGSILIECKASRSDFRADKDKPTRRHSALEPKFPAVGLHRYYMAPAGIIPVDELLPGWGLLEVDGKGKVKKVKASEYHQVAHDREARFLLSLIRRMGPNHPKGAFCKFYTIENKTLATVGILAEDALLQDEKP